MNTTTPALGQTTALAAGHRLTVLWLSDLIDRREFPTSALHQISDPIFLS